MAESQRRGSGSAAVVDDDTQTKKDRMFLLFFLLGMVGLVGLMVLIAKFLSGQ